MDLGFDHGGLVKGFCGPDGEDDEVEAAARRLSVGIAFLAMVWLRYGFH